MALTKNPKLALIPSGYKASKVYSVLPSDGVGDFDFSRNGSATRVNKQGLIETVASNVSRLNYPLIDGVVSGCPSLLLEPERRNLVTYSEDFIQSYWSKIGSSISPNISISPDGTQNASKFVEDNLNGLKRLRINSISTSGDNTLSFFVKSAERKWILLREAGQTGAYAFFDLENGVIGQSNLAENIEIKQFNNDWYRISFKDSVTSVAIELRLALSDGVQSYQGDGTSGLYIWGAMVEQGSFPTSYIPSLTGSQTTRSAETCNNSGDANTFNDSEGVLMAEVNFENNDTNKGISISDGTSSNRVLFYLATNGNLYGYVFNGNGSIPIVTIIDTNFQINLTAKLAIKYKQNDFSFWVNGIEIGTETIGNTFSSGVLNQLSFTSYGSSANPFYGNTKQIQYFDTSLTDTDLEELTSWTSFNEMATAQQYTIL